MAITNSTIAQAVNDLVEYWDALNLEYATWLAGSVGGGPGLDGKYPLTDYLGNVRMTDCPAQLEDNVNSLVTGAQGYSDAADASATAAAASAAAASTSAGEADSDRLAAQAAQTAAESAQSAAESARATAIAQAAAASGSAAAAAADAISTAADAVSTAADAVATAADVTYSAEWANKAHGVLVSAAAGGDQVDDYSALHWATEAATFNPALYAALADSETITGAWTFSNYLNLTPMAAPAWAEGRLYYDSTEKAISYYNDEADVTINLGQENVIRARNTTGVTITNGSVVYISGAQGANLPLISLAQADALATAEAVGVVTHDIENNSNGYVTTLGVVRDLNTSSYTAGDELFLSTSVAGGMTNVKPTTGYAIPIGYVTVVNVSIGEIKVTMHGEPISQDKQSNWDAAYATVDATGITDGYVLTADGAGNAGWEVGAVPADYAELGTVTQSDTYLYLNRNTAGGGGPVLHVAQVGSGPIAKFGKVASLGSTGHDPVITFGDNSLPGSITVESTVTDASIYLKADTSNTVETANPFIRMEQDGNAVQAIFGLTGADNVDPQGTAMTGAGNNSLVIHAPYNASEINLGVDGSVGLTITGTDQILGGSTWGTAGFPTFSSAVDANSGMYVSASDTLGFSTGGIERVKIDVNGLTMVASGADLILGNNSLTAENISSSAGSAPLKIGNGTGTPMVWGQYCALARTYSAARTGLANNAYVDTDDVVSGQWRHLVTHGSYGHTILEMAAGTFFFYGKSESVTSGNIVTLNQYAQMDPGNGFKITGTGNVNPGTSWSSLSKDMLHIDGKETIDGNDTYLRLNQNLDYTSGTYTPGVFRVDGGLKLNADCTLSRQSSSQARVTTAYGYCDIGPNNTSYAHFNTDRTKFYFNKELHINGQSRYYNLGALYYNGSSSYPNGKVTFSTSAATGGATGDIWYQYT